MILASRKPRSNKTSCAVSWLCNGPSRHRTRTLFSLLPPPSESVGVCVGGCVYVWSFEHNWAQTCSGAHNKAPEGPTFPKSIFRNQLSLPPATNHSTICIDLFAHRVLQHRGFCREHMYAYTYVVTTQKKWPFIICAQFGMVITFSRYDRHSNARKRFMCECVRWARAHIWSAWAATMGGKVSQTIRLTSSRRFAPVCAAGAGI